MKFDYIPLPNISKLPRLDFTEENNLDPLGIQKFFDDEMDCYQNNKLSRIVVVKNWKQAIGYFAVSMNAIEVKQELEQDEKVPGTTTRKYPAMLIGRMGVDKKYRKKGIGKAICSYCVGLATDLSLRVGCRYVMLQTSIDKVEFYKKCGFTLSKKPPKNEKVWMYRRLV